MKILYYVLILLVITIIIQILRRRLFSATTFFAGYFICFYVLAPMIVRRVYPSTDVISLKGVLVWLCTCIFLEVVFAIKRKNPVDKNYKSFNKSIEEYNNIKNWCILICFIASLLLIISLNVSGIVSVLMGQKSSKEIMRDHNTLFTIYDYFRHWWGYLIILELITKKGKITKFIVLNLAFFFAQTILFSFARASLVYIICMFAIVCLKDHSTLKQITIFGFVVLLCTFIMVIGGFIRTWGIRDGISSYNFQYALSILDSSLDFTIVYKHFAEVINSDVRITPLVYLKTMFSVIPRSIWSDKPYASSIEILRQLHFDLWSKGYSTGYSFLGEAYAVLGDFGIYFYPIIYGVIVTFVDRKNYCIKRPFLSEFSQLIYIYFIVVFLLECNRQGGDIAMLNLILYMLPIYLLLRISIRVKIRTPKVLLVHRSRQINL